MTDVRIRHVNNARGRSLGDVPFGDIDTVIPLLKEWGVYTGEEYETSLSGQFNVSEDGVYFEVLVGDE